ncbi:MAG: hypothetical protein LAP39_29390 [Acidobacteriia bacterium]|nr:hypothetical protein [Terriglobia bacterium]
MKSHLQPGYSQASAVLSPRTDRRVLEHTLGVDQLEGTYTTLRAMNDETPLAERLLHLDATERVSEKDLEQERAQGRSCWS